MRQATSKRLNRFIGDFVLREGKMEIADPAIVHQVREVLKLKIGEHIILCDGKGSEAEATIKGFSEKNVEVELARHVAIDNEPDCSVALYCAILKNENFELVVQKATEIGVKEIIPVITERTIKLNIRHDRLERIAREAAEQCGRGIVPMIHDAISFKDFVPTSGKMNFLFDPSGALLHDSRFEFYDVNIWIGPEGGWSPVELELAREKKFTIACLGSLTLRAETAAIVASYLAVTGGIGF